MAITVTTDMFYTRAGESDPSDVLSAHDPLIWEFEDGAITANPTATVEFLIKDNAGSVIYTSDPFSAYLLSFSAPTAKFRFDATEIVKHIISTYFYKETSGVIEAENYGSEVEVRIRTFDDAVQEDSKLLEYFGSHALNQIGDEYGSNIPRLFYNDTEEIAHFLGFPNHVFFYLSANLSAETPLIEILESTLNKITAWVNSNYETFTSSGATITLAICTIIAEERAASNTFEINAGDVVVIIFTLTLNSGTAPRLELIDNGGSTISNTESAANGANFIILTSTESISDCRIRIFQSFAVGNWSTDEVVATKYEWYSQEGTLGLFMHDLNLGLFQLTKDTKIVNVKYDPADPTLIKTYNITAFLPCLNSVYIRLLTKDGYYMYWAFSPFPTTSQQSNDIGKVINSFSEMALANSRNFPIGKKDAFKRLSVAAAAVPIVFRRKLMDLFTSPAVYLWQGKETPNENLITAFAQSGSPYDTLTTSGDVIISAINAAGSVAFYTNTSIYKIQQGGSVTVIFNLTLNSGQAPTIGLIDSGTALSSNQVLSANGFNIIKLVATKEIDFRMRFINGAATNFSTGKVIAKRAEVEADWILLEGVEGSHDLREKKQADNFSATLVLPEKYTQQLSGQNL